MPESYLKNIKMETEEMINRLKRIVTVYTQNKEALETMNGETDFINDLQINSANLVDVILDVEEEFDIEIDNQSMEKMLNVQASLEIISEKLAQK